MAATATTTTTAVAAARTIAHSLGAACLVEGCWGDAALTATRAPRWGCTWGRTFSLPCGSACLTRLLTVCVCAVVCVCGCMCLFACVCHRSMTLPGVTAQSMAAALHQCVPVMRFAQGLTTQGARPAWTANDDASSVMSGSSASHRPEDSLGGGSRVDTPGHDATLSAPGGAANARYQAMQARTGHRTARSAAAQLPRDGGGRGDEALASHHDTPAQALHRFNAHHTQPRSRSSAALGRPLSRGGMLVVSGSSNIASGIRSAASAGDAYTGGAGEVASTTQLSVTLGSHDMAQANAVRVDVTGVTVFWAPVRANLRFRRYGAALGLTMLFARHRCRIACCRCCTRHIRLLNGHRHQARCVAIRWPC